MRRKTTSKDNMKKAQKELGDLLDDLDLGDFAYLQKQALQADGHPLGDYMSWLLSSHLASLAFEHDLRNEQAAVDAMDFDDTLVSSAEPSTVVATFYHSALFARNQRRLGPHPRAKPDQKMDENACAAGQEPVLLVKSKPVAVRFGKIQRMTKGVYKTRAVGSANTSAAERCTKLSRIPTAATAIPSTIKKATVKARIIFLLSCSFYRGSKQRESVGRTAYGVHSG
jgi:hypothetical protein